jgi:hypothetical protein
MPIGFDVEQEHLNAVSAAVDLAVRETRPNIAFVHVKRRSGGTLNGYLVRVNESSNARDLYKGSVIISAGVPASREIEIDYRDILQIRSVPND